MSITVSLDTSAKPPVTVSPNPYDVSAATAESLTWAPATGQTFTFKSLVFANNPSCMGTPVVAPALVTVQDTNGTNPGSPAVTYPYTVVVEYNGQSYSSAETGITGGGTSPGIRNR
jgi:hypothetical protein